MSDFKVLYHNVITVHVLMCLLSFVVEYLNAVRAKVGEVVSGIIMILCVCVCVCVPAYVCLSLSVSVSVFVSA